MLVVGIGICSYLNFLSSLCVYFVLYLLINIKKVGFLKAIKSKTAVILIVLIALCVSAPALFFGLDLLPRSGDHLFKDHILKPVPDSVEILDSFDGSPGFYPDDCLHFKISPADFQLVLASKKWETVSDSELPFSSLECEFGNSAWSFSYPPPALGSDVTTYTFIPYKRDIEIMFTNDEMNEVYYFYFNGNLP